MRATPRYLIGSAAVLTGVILLTTVWALTREPPPLASCRLPDGAVLRLEAVTCGPIHRFKSGPYWQRLLARTPFPYLRTLAGDPMHEIRGSTLDSLMFWLSHAPESHTMSNMMLNWHPEAINERCDSYETCPSDSALIRS